MDFDPLYRQFGPLVYRRCRRLLGDDAQAADAMHDVFVALLRRRDITLNSPPALLYKVATDVCLNRLRTRRRHPESSEDELLQSIACWDGPGADVEHRTLLDRIFLREPASTRTIAVLHWVDGMTHEEVARAMRMSVSGVRKRLRVLQARAPLSLGDLP